MFGVRRICSLLHTKPQDFQKISKMPFFKAYKQGVQLTAKRQLQKANRCFEQALKNIQQLKQEQFQHFVSILHKITRNNIEMGKNTLAQQNLYEVIQRRKQQDKSVLLLAKHYHNLYAHLLTFNPSKAIRLCKALLSDEKNLSISSISLFTFNLANGYLLVGNYSDAKEKYLKCLELQPSLLMTAQAYNNLALACWWHKNPFCTPQQPFPENDLKVTQNFKQAPDLLRKAIGLSEGEEDHDQKRKLLLSEFLEGISMSSELRFPGKHSHTYLYNLAEYYCHNDPAQEASIIYLFHKAMQGAIIQKDTFKYHHISCMLSLLLNDRQKLQQELKVLLSRVSGLQSLQYLKLQSIIQAQNGRHSEAADLKLKFQNIESNATTPMLIWAAAKKFVCHYSFDFQ